MSENKTAVKLTLENARDALLAKANPTEADIAQAKSYDAAIINLATMDNATLSGVKLEFKGGSFVQPRQSDDQVTYTASQQGGDGSSLMSRGYSQVVTINPNGRGKTAEELFDRPTPKSGFKSLAEQMWHIHNGTQMAAVGASAGVPSDGGYMIAPEYQDIMLNKSLESEVVRPYADVVGMKSDELVVTDFDDSTHASATYFGGLKFTWAAEGDAPAYQFPKLRQMKLSAKKAMMLVPATNELLTDARSYGPKLQNAMTGAVGDGLDEVFLTSGLGGGQPVSCLKADSTITVAKESGQAADTILWENLCSMFSRLHPGCIQNSRWVFSSTCIPQLLQLTIPTGTGGQAVPVMTGTNGDYRILTRPVLFSEKMSLLGDLGDCMLVDFSQYLVGIRENGFRLDTSGHVLFTSDQTVFRLIARIDGRPKWAAPFQPKNSAPTQSWCVTLQAR